MILLNPTRPCASPLFPKHQSLTTAQLHLSQLLVPETHTLFALVGSKVWTRIWRWWTLPGVDFHGLLGEPAGGRKNSTNVTQSQGASAREKQFLNTEQIFVTKFVNFSERTAEAKQKKGKPWFLNQMTIRSEQLSQTKDSGHLEASEPCPPWHLWQTVVALAGLQWLSTPGASSAASAYSPGDTGRKNLKGLQVVKKKKRVDGEQSETEFLCCCFHHFFPGLVYSRSAMDYKNIKFYLPNTPILPPFCLLLHVTTQDFFHSELDKCNSVLSLLTASSLSYF